MAATKVDVLALAEQRAGDGITQLALMVKFGLTRQAARRHLDRLTRRGLLSPDSAVAPLATCTFTLTPRGRKRLAWYRLSDDERGAGRITFA